MRALCKARDPHHAVRRFEGVLREFGDLARGCPGTRPPALDAMLKKDDV
jgi:hypothetical protein